MNLKDYLRIIRRRLLTVLLIAGLIYGANFLLMQKQPTVFSTDTVFIVKRPDTRYIIQSAGAIPTAFEIMSESTLINLIKTEKVMQLLVFVLDSLYPQIYDSPDVSIDKEKPLRKNLPEDFVILNEIRKSEKERNIVDEAGIKRKIAIDRNYSSKKVREIASSLVNFISVSKVPQTDMLEVRVEHSDAIFAEKLANAVPVAFETYMQIDFNRRIQRMKEILEDNKEKLGKEADEYQEIIDNLTPKLTIKVPEGVEDDYIKFLRGKIGEYESKIAELRYEIEEKTEELNANVYPVVSIEETAVIKQYRDILREITREIEELKQKLTPQNPQLKKLQVRFDYYQNLLQDELKKVEKVVSVKGKGELYSVIVNKNKELKKNINLKTDWEKKLEQHLKEKYKTEKIEYKEEEKQDDKDITKTIKSYEFKIETAEANIKDIEKTKLFISLLGPSHVPRVEIVSEAQKGTPRVGIAKNTWPFVLLLGFVVGIASAFFLEYITTTIRTEHDVKRYVNLPLLGAVKKIVDKDKRLLVDVSPRDTSIVEVFNTISTLIESYAVEHKAKMFMIASSKPEEGKSTIATNIGVAMARGGERVLLLDCDLRKAILHNFLNVDNSVGISTYLLTQTEMRLQEGDSDKSTASTLQLKEVIKPTEVENLLLLPAGPHPQNPVTLLKSNAFKKLILEARDVADIVLVDVPPINLAVDTMLLAPLVDGIILLVSANETGKEEVSYAKRLVESARGKFIGTILNKMTIQSRGYYYYYYYYYDTYKYYREV